MAEAPIRDLFVEGFAADSGSASDVVYRLDVTLTDDNDAVFTGLAGATSTFQVRKGGYRGDVLMTATVGDGISINATSGVVGLALTLSHFAQFATDSRESVYQYDWDLVDADGNHYRLYKGDFTLFGDI